MDNKKLDNESSLIILEKLQILQKTLKQEIALREIFLNNKEELFEKIELNTYEYYKKKLSIQEIYFNNKELNPTTEKQYIKYELSKDCQSELPQCIDPLTKLFFYFRNNNDMLLKGKIKHNYFLIDLNEGKIIEEIKDLNDDNYIQKKLKQNNNNLIAFKKVEYYLEKIDINSKKVIMNITTHDITIINNEDSSYILLETKEHLEKFIENFELKIEIDEIISIYCYSYIDKKLNMLIKIRLWKITLAKIKMKKE